METPRRVRSAAFLACAIMAAGAAACGGSSDLADLRATVTSSGWSAVGGDGASTRYVPLVEVTIENAGHEALDHVDVFVSFWPADADGEKDVQQVPATYTRTLDAGRSTPALLIRSAVGYNLSEESAGLFSNPSFRDWTIRIFARRAGRIVSLGQFAIARRLVEPAPATDQLSDAGPAERLVTARIGAIRAAV